MTIQKVIRIRAREVLAIVLLAAVTVVAAGQNNALTAVGADEQISRDAQASLLFSRMSASILDVVDRVQFRITDSELQLVDVWFRRRPHVLTDGVSLVQTQQFDRTVFVRQVMEHPLARKTVIVFPGYPTDQNAIGARLLAMAEAWALNSSRALSVAGEAEDGGVQFYGSGPVPAAFPSAAVTTGFLSGAPAHRVFALWAGLPDDGPIAGPVPPAGQTATRPRETETPAERTRAAILSMLRNEDSTAARLLDGQGLLVIEEIERAIRRAVGESADLHPNQIGVVNDLQNQLASTVGRADLRLLVFDNEYDATRTAASTLRAIDDLIGSHTESIFLGGIESIRTLFMSDIPLDLLPLIVSDRGAAPEEPIPAASGSPLRTWISGLPPGALSIVEVPLPRLYDLVQWSLEGSDFNLVIMSQPGGEPQSTCRTFREAELTLHPDMSAQAPQSAIDEYRRWSVAEQLSLNLVTCDMEPDTVVVSQRSIGDRGLLVGAAIRSGSDEPVVRFYLLPAVEARQIRAAVDGLISTASLSPLEVAILEKWAIVAQTAVDL